jgi:type I restriction enzyme S subunit
MFGDPVTNPKGWETGELNNYLDFLTSGSRGWAKYYSNSGDKFIRIQNVSNNKLLLEDLAYVNAPDGAEARRTKIQIGDVLLSITADLGRSAVVTEEITGGYINQHLALLRINQNILNSRYLAAYLSSEAGVKQFQAKNKSAVKAGLNFTDIKSLNILMPPIEQQKKYEQMYKKVVSLVSSKQKSMQLSETIFNSLSQKAFAGEL